FLHFVIFFRSKRTSAHSTKYSSRLGSSCLRSFSALCQADDKVCHQLEPPIRSVAFRLLPFDFVSGLAY
ncbi:MAG: hypothetical protein IJB76_00215, partial [Clostridia bacterium]|nr:hypothetical protein [Clostridia bacterium]